MARIHGIVVLVAIAGGTALWFAATQGPEVAPPLPETTESPKPAQPAAQPDAATSRATIAQPDGAKDTSTAPKSHSEAPQAKDALEADAAAPVDLIVRSLVGSQEIPRFGWRFVPQSGATTKGLGENGRARLPLPFAQIGELHVEAEGKRPHTQRITTPQAGAPTTQIDVFLEDAVALAAVTLQMRDSLEQIVTRARIELWLLDKSQPATPPEQDPVHEPLWKRAGSAADGMLALPEIAPGDYALRAQPVGEDGFALPLQPARFRFTFRGGEAVPLSAVFAPGCVLRIECADDGSEPALVDLVTRPAFGADPIRVAWQSRDSKGQAATGIDAAMLPGRAQSAIALPLGTYFVEASRAQTQLLLREEQSTQSERRWSLLALPR